MPRIRDGDTNPLVEGIRIYGELYYVASMEGAGVDNIYIVHQRVAFAMLKESKKR